MIQESGRRPMQQPHENETPVLLHVHIPKTAGMALNDCILEMYRNEEWSEDERGLISGVYYYPAGIEAETTFNERALHILSTKEVRAVVGHFSFGLHEWVARPCEYVTLLRHPVDRVVSLYHHIKTWDHDVRLHEEVVTRNMSLTDFVQDLEFTEVDNGQTRRIAGAQPSFGKCDKDLLAQAQKNLADRFAMVGLTEKFAESVAVMKHRLRWPRLPRLKWKNVNRSRPQNLRLSEETLAAIVERNKWDLQLYAFAEAQLLRQIEEDAHNFGPELSMVRQLLEDEAEGREQTL